MAVGDVLDIVAVKKKPKSTKTKPPGSEAPAKQKGTKDNVKKQKITKAVTAHDDPKKLEDSKANRQIQKITGTVTKPNGATIWKHNVTRGLRFAPSSSMGASCCT